jgi:hypothetical protein
LRDLCETWTIRSFRLWLVQPLTDQNSDQNGGSDGNSRTHHETPSPHGSLIGKNSSYDILSHLSRRDWTR